MTKLSPSFRDFDSAATASVPPASPVAQSAAAVLSIVMPVYNEATMVAQVIGRLVAVEFPVDREIIIVDDGSTDGTPQILQQFVGRPDTTVLCSERNRGKGAAIRLGIRRARGSILAIQDADLELDPAQLPALIRPLLTADAEVVYGSRFLGSNPDIPRLGRWANRTLTALTNLLCGGHVTDMETCYKVLPMQLARSLALESDRFEIEAEITAKLLRRGHRIVELPIEVRPRSKSAGKKIGWRDGVHAVRALLRYGLMDRLTGQHEREPRRNPFPD